MKFENTVARECRYGDILGCLIGCAEVIWEKSVSGYQGDVSILWKVDGEFYFYGYSYGSCSSCDEWEHRKLTDTEILSEMGRGVICLDNIEQAVAYFKRFEDQSILTSLLDIERKNIV